MLKRVVVEEVLMLGLSGYEKLEDSIKADNFYVSNYLSESELKHLNESLKQDNKSKLFDKVKELYSDGHSDISNSKDDENDEEKILTSYRNLFLIKDGMPIGFIDYDISLSCFLSSENKDEQEFINEETSFNNVSDIVNFNRNNKEINAHIIIGIEEVFLHQEYRGFGLSNLLSNAIKEEVLSEVYYPLSFLAKKDNNINYTINADLVSEEGEAFVLSLGSLLKDEIRFIDRDFNQKSYLTFEMGL